MSDDLRSILYSALSEPVGLLLAVDGDPIRARQKLYKVRHELRDPALARLQIRASPLAEGELIIIKSEAIGDVPEPLGLPPPATGAVPSKPEDLEV